MPGGQLTTALALTGANDGDWAGGGRSGGIQARVDGGVWRLYGEAGQVLDGHTAGVLLVAAHTGGFARGRTQLFLVRTDGRASEGDARGAPPAEVSGLLRTRQTVMDETRSQAQGGTARGSGRVAGGDR